MQPEYSQPLADYVRFFANDRPDAIAYKDSGRVCSYKEADLRSNQISWGLAGLGCQEGDRIAYVGVNSGIHIEAFFGAMKAKVIFAGVNWRLTAPEFEYILQDSGIKVVLCDQQFVAVFEALQKVVPTLKHILCVEPDSFDRWREQFKSTDPALAHTPEDDVVLFYTSGTTGKPKGVALNNRGMGEHRKGEDQYGDWYMSSNRQEVLINAMPNFHVGGLGWILMGMFRGATMIQMPGPDPEQFLDLIESEQATHLFAVPVILGMMLEAQKKQARDLSSLAVYHYGSSPIAPSMLAEAIDVMACGFTQYYGMTENNGVVTNLPPSQHRLDNPERLKSCGIPMAGITIKIVDSNGDEMPVNTAGEIWINSPGLMSSYWNNTKASEEVLVDGWYHSGDGGKIDEEGYLYIADRIKDMIITGGENVYPAEVEGVLTAHPAVKEVAVIGIPDEKWGEAVKAVIVPVDGCTVDAEQLIAFLRERLAGFKIPRIYDTIDILPRNLSGKIQKFKLR